VQLLFVNIACAKVTYSGVLLFAAQLRTDATYVAIFKSSIPYLAENVSLH